VAAAVRSAYEGGEVMTDPFEVLHIEPVFDVDLGAVEQRVRDLSRVLHPDRHAGASATDRRMSLGRAIDVNEAWRIVRDPIRRAEALLSRSGTTLTETEGPKAAPGFLMDFMEQREALSEAKQKGDAAAIERLGASVRAKEGEATRRLSAVFAAAGGDPARLRDAAEIVGELRYYRRFLDEVGAIEDERAEAAAQ
jgi:molecular chaperone HscB